jgi:hypothetical protein
MSFLTRTRVDLGKAQTVTLYTNGSKMGEDVAAGYCQISVQGRYTLAKNISLGKKLEIIDAELAAVY